MIVAHLLRFHLRVGVRVALRTLVPVAAAVVSAAVMYGSLTSVMAPVAELLFPRRPSTGAALLAVVLSAGVAAACAPRLATGLSGWLRHLPASVVAHRRALVAGLVLAQAPVLALVAASGALFLEGRVSTSLPRLAGLLALAWGATLAVLPVEGRGARAAALAGAAAAWYGAWPALAVAAALLAVAEWRAGGLVAKPPRRLVGAARDAAARRLGGPRRAPSAAELWMVMAWRALRWRLLAGWLAVPAVLLPAWLFLRNNPLSDDQALVAVRLCGLAAAAIAMAVVGDSLVRRRPPWPWVRSLPWPAAARIGSDALLLAVVSAPAVAVAVAMAPASAAPLLASLPLLAVRGAAAVRDGVDRASGASGALLVEGLLVAALVALVPWVAAALLALVPLAVRLAAESERRQPVSRWHELHHLAAGDPLSWSGR